MSKKKKIEKAAPLLTWKEAYSFCAPHVASVKDKRPQLERVSVRISSTNPEIVWMASTNGQSGAFLEIGAGWFFSALPLVSRGDLEEGWQYIDKAGQIIPRKESWDHFPSEISNVIPAQLEHVPCRGPHLGVWTFEALLKSFKAVKVKSGTWYLHQDPSPNSPGLCKIHLERLSLYSAWLLAMPTRTNGTDRARGRMLEGL